MPGTPLTITLYDENDEIKATYSRAFVPWRILKAAVRLAKSFDVNNMSEDDVDALAALVVEAFGNRFSVEDLNNGADVTEMVAVLQMIINKARGFLPTNPTPPGQ
jgi:hypothetical protein